jgi:hypothetical protein
LTPGHRTEIRSRWTDKNLYLLFICPYEELQMRIPIDKIDKRKPQAGQELRINFYRIQGPPPYRNRIAWQPTNTDNYHVPEAFGRLRMEK